MQEGLKEQSNLVVRSFFRKSSFFWEVHRNWTCPPLSCIYRSLLLITTVETVTWELNCSKCCNLYFCSPRLHHWSWKWERWCLASVKKSEKSITSFMLYNLLLFNFWGQFQRLSVTVGRNPEILICKMCDSLRSGKGCLGKAGTTPVQMQTLVGAKETSLPTILGRACSKKDCSSWK